MTHIDFETLEGRIEQLEASFRVATPFEHVVIDDFLKPNSLDALLCAIPAPNDQQRSSDYIFAKNKFENPTFGSNQSVLSELRAEFLSERFAKFISKIFGKELFVDPEFVGGGIHLGGSGSYLDMHADFSRHPTDRYWLRELNILLYLNDKYNESYGGHLELEHSETHQKGRVAPLLNRLVLMLTKSHTLHGYKPLNFPPGMYRTSLAAYAYSIDHDFDAQPARSTLWKPQDASPVKAVLAAISPALVRAKTAVFGSNTVNRTNAGKKRRK